jgi:hypothetical protein
MDPSGDIKNICIAYVWRLFAVKVYALRCKSTEHEPRRRIHSVGIVIILDIFSKSVVFVLILYKI